MSVTRLRSTEYRRYYYADIRFRKLVFTKKRGRQVRYTTVFVGTFTPKEFRKAVYGGVIKKIIERELVALVAGELPPYAVEGFWTSRKAKERV